MSSRFRDQVPLWASFYFFQLLVYAFLIFYTKKNNVFWQLGYIFFENCPFSDVNENWYFSTVHEKSRIFDSQKSEKC